MAGRRSNYKRIKQVLSQTPGGEKLYTDWQDRQAYCLGALVESSPVFNRDIAALRNDQNRDIRQKAVYIVKKYAKFGLRPYALPMVAHFIEYDKLNSWTMLPPVIAVSTKENIAGPAVAFNDFKKLKEELDAEFARNPNERVYLVIHPDAMKEDILEWININYDFFLSRLLDKLDPTRPKRIKTPNLENLKRDMALYEHIIVNGLPAKDVADEYSLNEVEANKYAKTIQNKIVEPDK